MKTAEEMAQLVSGVWTDRKIKHLEQFEKEIRADERENRIKELNSIGEFKTDSEAQEYCRLHGLDIHTTRGNLYRIAGALMDARKDQDKITRNACDESMLACYEDGISPDGYPGYVHADEAHQAIMSVKTI